MLNFEINDFLKTLRACFQADGKDIRFVGGCVRDALAGRTPKDFDLCTDATPVEQMVIYNRHGYRFVETGLQHGTLTVVEPGTGEPYEITSLRIDTDCDGRHAQVVFTSDWEADAMRRDLTINSMSVNFDGKLFDPFGGKADLDQGRVRFVGDARERIREDYLRILRFFRFLGRFGDPADAVPATLLVIAMKADGLKQISVERVWSEMSRILVGPNAHAVVNLMQQAGVTAALDFPGTPCKVESNNPITQLVAYSVDPVELTLRWKMSLGEQKLALFLAQHREGVVDYRYEAAHNRVAMEWLCELAALRGEQCAYAELLDWIVPLFPVTGADVLAAGFKPGKTVGEVLRWAKERWAASRFTLTKEELIAGLNPVGYRELFPHEIEAQNEQIKLANDEAKAALAKAGHRGVHPRVVELRSRGVNI